MNRPLTTAEVKADVDLRVNSKELEHAKAHIAELDAKIKALNMQRDRQMRAVGMLEDRIYHAKQALEKARETPP